MQISPATIKNIDHAANLILKGGLVAFPTETVYGIGAIASNKNAINRIYSIKGRPKKKSINSSYSQYRSSFNNSKM